MSLAPGSRLGPYEVSTLIGVGGMGEVYAATDVDLACRVAIKVLPDSVAAVFVQNWFEEIRARVPAR